MPNLPDDYPPPFVAPFELPKTHVQRMAEQIRDMQNISDATRLEVLRAVAHERRRQDNRWGEQNHPDVDPVAAASWSIADHYDLRGATAARGVVLREAVVVEHGPSWLAILLEEVAEVAEAAENGDERALEAELVQVAAVAVAQVEHLRRRRAARQVELAQTLARVGVVDVSDAGALEAKLRDELGLPPRG